MILGDGVTNFTNEAAWIYLCIWVLGFITSFAFLVSILFFSSVFFSFFISVYIPFLATSWLVLVFHLVSWFIYHLRMLQLLLLLLHDHPSLNTQQK